MLPNLVGKPVQELTNCGGNGEKSPLVTQSPPPPAPAGCARGAPDSTAQHMAPIPFFWPSAAWD